MVPQTTSRWMSITLNWNSSVVETNTLVSFTMHCRVHLGHTYHTYTQTLHSTMSRQPSLLPVATTSSLTARYVAHTLERLLAYAVVVDRPLRCTWSYACSHTPSSLTARFVAHTVVRLLAYAVVVDRPLRCTWSYACSHTPSSSTARFVAHTVVRLLAHAVVVDRPFRRTHGRTPARIRRRREVTNALYHCTAASEYSRPRSLPHSNSGLLSGWPIHPSLHTSSV